MAAPFRVTVRKEEKIQVLKDRTPPPPIGFRSTPCNILQYGISENKLKINGLFKKPKLYIKRRYASLLDKL